MTLTSVHALPRAYGGPLATGTLRARPEDFQVEEILDFDPEGEGPYLWLRVRKTNANTHWVAERLAALAGCAPDDVGFAGLKDRHAVTTQWFSVRVGEGAVDWSALPDEGIEVLDQHVHRHKLRRGELDANRFVIRIRDFRPDPEALLSRMQGLARGLPNYFGEQRFGRDEGNLDAARRMFDGEHVADRKLRGLYFSAARSALFNEVLARRVLAGHWDEPMDGEQFVDNDNEPVFVSAMDERNRGRLSGGRIHPSGPMWGRGYPAVRAACLELERQVAAENTALVAGLEKAGLHMQRRSLRLMPRDFSGSWRDDEFGPAFEVRFELPRGAFATALLRELVSAAAD